MSILRHGGDLRGPALRLLTLGDARLRPSPRARPSRCTAEHTADPADAADGTDTTPAADTAFASDIAAAKGAATAAKTDGRAPDAAAGAVPADGASAESASADAAPLRSAGHAATAVIRAVISVLMLGAAVFYLAVAVKGVGGLLLGPPPEMVTTADDTVAATAPGPGAHHLEVLLRPLAITGAALAGLLLLWSGAAGLNTAGDRRRWRGRQAAGLAGLGLGSLAFALGLAAAGGEPAAYVGPVWLGVEPIRPSIALALLAVTAALLPSTVRPSAAARPSASAPARPVSLQAGR